MAKKNFVITTVATAPDPATTGTSLVVASGKGALFADDEPAIVFPEGEQPDSSNAEIVMVTNIATDTLTITREQESTTARTIVVGDIIMQGITAKDWNDLMASGFTWKGAWATSTVYAVNDTVENDGSGYVCTQGHTSGASTEPSVGASWTDYWDLFVAGWNKDATETLTNKTIDADVNTIADLTVSNLKSGVLDTDLASVSASDDTVASAKAIRTAIDNGVLYGVDRQAIINGNFDVWQRGTSFAGLTAITYTADRWVFAPSGGTATVSRQTFTVGQTDVPNNPTYYLRLQCTSANDNVGTTQRIEDVRTFSGETVTASFYAKADSNRTLSCRFVQYFGSGGSADVAIGAQTASVTTSWQLLTFTFDIPSISGKTVGAGNHIYIYIYNAANETFTFDLASVQVCKGSVALPFCPKTYQQELLDCSRYYQVFSVDNYVCYADGNQLAVPFYGAVPMRLTGDLKAYAVTLSAIYAHRVNTTTVVTLYNTATAMTGSTNAVNYGVYGKTQGWIEWTGAITEDVYVANNSSSAGNQVSGTARFYIDVEL